MNKFLNSRQAVPVFLSLAFIIPLNSVAEELDSEITVAQNGALELEGMTVRAKPINRNLIKLQPFASTIVDRKELNRLKFVDPDEVMNRIPGQSLSRNLRIPKGGRGYTISVVDGVSVRDPYRGSTQQFQDNNTFDIERIEIIKGPTSVLYGSNAFGGVVNVITREPPIDTEYRAWFEGGSFDRIRGGLNTGGTVKDVGYFLDFNIWDIGGFQDFEKNDRKAVSGKLVFHPDSLSNLTVRGEYLDRFSKSPGSLKQAQFDEDPRQNPRPNVFSEQETYTGSMKFDREMWNNGHINANFGYRSDDSFSVSTFGGGGPSDTKLDDLNAKLWYTHKFDFLNSSFMLGGDYFYGENDTKRLDQKKKGFLNSTAYTERKIYAGFAELKFSPIERLELTAAFRYETVESNSKGVTYAENKRVRGKSQHVILATPELSDSNPSFSKISPVAGFTFDISEDHRFWFNYAQGFYVPSVRSMFESDNANPNLVPEETELFQLGMRGAFLDNRLSYDVTFYYQDNINDLVDEVIGFDNVTGQNILAFANAGKANYRGVETEISYEPWDFLQLSVTHTYARNKYVEYINKNEDGSVKTDYSGNTLRISPEHHVNARIAVLPTEGLEIELEIDAYTSYATHDDNSLDPDGDYSKPIHLNLRTSYEIKDWELWLHALNLTNELEERVTYSSRGPGGRTINVADGISVYGGVAFNF